MKQSVALVVRDADDRFLIVKRPDDPADPLALVWGLPAITLLPGEDEHAAAERVGLVKLGVTLAVGRKLGELTASRGDYLLRLSDYEATVVSGKVSVPQPDDSMTQYVECRFTSDPALLNEAARRGSLCVRIFLESIPAH
jgi:hypothetical protein